MSEEIATLVEIVTKGSRQQQEELLKRPTKIVLFKMAQMGSMPMAAKVAQRSDLDSVLIRTLRSRRSQWW